MFVLLLYFTASISFTIALMSFMRVAFVYKSFSHKYFFFSLTSLLTALYITCVIYSFLSDPLQTVPITRIKMLILNLANLCWLSCLYKLFFDDSNLLKVLWAVNVPVLLLLWGDNFISEPVTENVFYFFRERYVRRVPSPRLFYLIDVTLIFVNVVIVFVRLFGAQMGIRDKRVLFLALMPYAGGTYDLLDVLFRWHSFMMTEFFFFFGLLSVFVYFLREDRVHYLKIINLNKEFETEVANRTKELIDANSQLEQLNLLKNDFIVNITHDFRSPITVILCSAQLVLDDWKNNNDKKNMINLSLKCIIDSAKKLNAAVNHLLELARMENAGVVLHHKKTDLDDFTSRITSYYASTVINRGVAVVRVPVENKPESLFVDRIRLEEIMDNVISNAIKYVDDETGRITVGLREDKKTVTIVIADNGVGIEPSRLESVFDRFGPTRAAKKSSVRGTGIGLAFSKQLLEMMGGSIRAESEGPGKGSAFFISLPKGLGHIRNGDQVEYEQSGNVLNCS